MEDIKSGVKLTFACIDSFHVGECLVGIAGQARQHDRRRHVHGQISAMLIIRNGGIAQIRRGRFGWMCLAGTGTMAQAGRPPPVGGGVAGGTIQGRG